MALRSDKSSASPIREEILAFRDINSFVDPLVSTAPRRLRLPKPGPSVQKTSQASQIPKSKSGGTGCSSKQTPTHASQSGRRSQQPSSSVKSKHLGIGGRVGALVNGGRVGSTVGALVGFNDNEGTAEGVRDGSVDSEGLSLGNPEGS